jgi:recombination associated protein RdgC
MDFLDILKQKSFLGREFLTWLWFKSEQTGGRIEITGDKTVQVVFLDRMTLDLSDAETPQSVAIRGEHSQLREGIAALREGKKIEEARVSVSAGQDEFTLILKGTWFAFGSLRTPAVLPSEEEDPEEGPEGRLLEKVHLIEEGIEIIDVLFAHFLKIRISEEWDSQELPMLRKWIASSDH